MLNLVAGLAFAGFVLAGLAAAHRPAAEALKARRRRVNLLILYVLAVSFAAGLSQREMWPFSAWTLMAGAAPTGMGERPRPASYRAVALDSAGREYRIDHRAWQPFNVEELGTWWDRVLPTLTADERRRTGAWLLEQANAARRTVRAGRDPGTFGRILGPFAAPTHSLHRALWTGPGTVPDGPFVGIRLYRETFEIEARNRDPEALRLDLAFEFPEAR